MGPDVPDGVAISEAVCCPDLSTDVARVRQRPLPASPSSALDRMPAVDRNVLRIGVFELLWAPDIPDGVAISEAVLLVQDLSTDASPAFVNGLLARIAELKPSLQV